MEFPGDSPVITQEAVDKFGWERVEAGSVTRQIAALT